MPWPEGPLGTSNIWIVLPFKSVHTCNSVLLTLSAIFKVCMVIK